MSALKTYDRGLTLQDEPMPWPFVLHEGGDVLAPGKWVSHSDYGGFGVIVAINDEQLTILWSQEPKGGFSSIAFPVVRRVFPSMVANQITSIQPMTQPSGLIFYLDYKYGGDAELDLKCSKGPAVSRMFWKAYRQFQCLKTRTRSLLSSLASSWRSWRTPSMTTGSNEAKRAVDKWAPAAKVTNGPTQQKIVKEYLKRQASAPKTLPPGPSSSSR